MIMLYNAIDNFGCVKFTLLYYILACFGKNIEYLNMNVMKNVAFAILRWSLEPHSYQIVLSDCIWVRNAMSSWAPRVPTVDGLESRPTVLPS
jgi:hypothetical protein